jgi:acyl transferase domain-containing protein
MTTQDDYNEAGGSEVAVVGMAGRFPGAADLGEFWRNLRDGVESVTCFTEAEAMEVGISRETLAGGRYVNAAPVLDGIELFDASFFGYTPREAEIMDPQHRLFLECAWQALENAGYDSERCRGEIGVFAGVSLSSYLMNIYANRKLLGLVTRFQIMIGNDKDHLPLRVSYKLNLKGPSLNVQTSCSTSLTTVHLACQSLLNGECDIALAGGASVKVPQRTGYLYQEGGINSSDGRCRPFDAAAQGTMSGSGVGVVVLKRLSDALADHDQILAVVKGSAVNNDGSLKVGYTAPSIDGQSQVIAEALSIAGVEAESVTYVEAHGTATPLGDPVEIAALTRAFRATTEKRNFCAVGSVKSNIGHLDAAAGVAGFIKTVLALHNRMLPPSLNFERPNPKIDFAASPFYVNAALSEWATGDAPRRAGVSSFGIGGTNVHVVMEEAPRREASGSSRPAQLLLLSAKTESALDDATANLAAHLRHEPTAPLADVAYTLQVGRRAFAHRRAVVCRDTEDALHVMTTRDPSRFLTNVPHPRSRSVVFMFPGQGAQHIEMGAGLYRHEATFRAEVDRCAELLRPQLGLDLRSVIAPGADAGADAAARLAQTNLTQPAVFVIEYALARLWMEWGVKPAAMIGHSVGEYVAACLAGVFTLEAALALVAWRGRLMHALPAGAMLAIALGEREVAPLLGGGLSLAAVNGERACVVAGAEESINELAARLEGDGVPSRRLQTSHAFHSEMMDAALAPFAAEVRRVKLQPPQLPYVSNVTGRWINASEATDADYWAQHMRQTVRFADGLTELLAEPDHVLLEVGPGQTLSALARRHPAKGAGHVVLSSLQRPGAGSSDEEDLSKALGQLWLAGVEVNWNGFYARERRQRLALPTYPFERQRHWVEHPSMMNATPAVFEQAAAADADDEPASPTLGIDETAEPIPVPPTPPVAEPSAAAQSVGVAGAVEAAAGHGDVRQRVVAQQLELMSRQLDVLRQRREGAGKF